MAETMAPQRVKRIMQYTPEQFCEVNAVKNWNRRATPENKPLTNGDLIRSMGNEELAVTLACPNEMGMAEIDCDHSDDKNCCQCLLDWLNQPCEPEQEAAL